jgi:hypothetical protein
VTGAAKMRFLRSVAGVSIQGQRRNEDVREKVQINNITHNVTEINGDMLKKQKESCPTIF